MATGSWAVSNGTTNDYTNQDVNRSVSCSFCNECIESPDKLKEHLILCGNKTDQCPKCGKFIRRAIFAYHYENNCSNPEEHNEASDNTVANRTILTTNVYGIKNLMECIYCSAKVERQDYDLHKKNCIKSPLNVAKKLQQNATRFTDPTLGMNQRVLMNDIKDEENIPCEYCNESIPWRHFNYHSKACQERAHKRLEEKARVKDENLIGKHIECVYCSASISPYMINSHELVCPKHPQNKTSFSNNNNISNNTTTYSTMTMRSQIDSSDKDTNHQRHVSTPSYNQYLDNNDGNVSLLWIFCSSVMQ
ncbi:unnamed protein product [Rotaria sordida]|uniref:Uncharacterized protein n=1 Tax=Rotaria sordida TaxID=392033 RepID=A0A816BLU6_9BILA|nr:unnamed protein product [Rotaria sordida]CAF1609962.1 unnamed protein product [Rotaria sordida]